MSGIAKARIRRIFLNGIALWTLLCATLVYLDSHENTEEVVENARTRAEESYGRDVLFRRWATDHGGVYVPVTEKTPPNPYLIVPEKNITTPSGKELTLINPAYMTRQIYELGSRNGIYAHITSLNPINPANAADPWERRALQIIEPQIRVFEEMSELRGEPFLRMMFPFVTEEGCLKCHARQGYKIGDLRGGIAVAIPMKSYLEKAGEETLASFISIGTLWLIGLGIMGISGRSLTGQADRIARVNDELERNISLLSSTFDSAPDGILAIDLEHRVEYANQTFYSMLDLEESSRSFNFHELLEQTVSWDRKALRNLIEFALTEPQHRIEIDRGDHTIFACTTVPHMRGGERVGTILILRNITREWQVKKELVAMNHLLGTLIDSAPVAIISLDSQDLVTGWNPAAEALFGWSGEEVLGKPIPIVPEDKLANYQYLHNSVVQGRVINGVQIQRQHKDGRTLELRLFSAPIRNMAGEIVGAMGIFDDISDMKRAEEAMLEAKIAAEEAARMKSEFLANISHEIRTPMNGVLGMLELLKEGTLPAEEAGLAEMAYSSAESLLRILNDILDFSKIDAGKMPIVPQPFSPPVMIDRISTEYRLLAERKGLSFTVNRTGELPLQLWGDRDRIRQILGNLLSNALKFTSRGGITLNVNALPTSDPALCMLRLQVTDTGIGINKADLHRLCSPFTQFDGSLTRQYGGTGLGLAISRALIDQMGGTLEITSTPGTGSSFTFCIPLSLHQGELPDEEHEGAPATGNHVLLVEDDAVSRLLVSRILQQKGWIIEETRTAEEALDRLQRIRFDLILLDIELPGMGGVTFIEELPQRGGINTDTPVIVMSAYTQEEDRNRLAGKQIVGFLPKPIRKYDLINLCALSARKGE